MVMFQVERYLPQPGVAGLAELVARATDASGQMTADGVAVRYVRCTFSEEDEMCFCLFEGPSSSAIQETNRRAGLTYERITTVVDIPATPAVARHTTGHKGTP
jgi:hypothetical protein